MVRRLLLVLLLFILVTKPLYTDKNEFISSQESTLSVQWKERYSKDSRDDYENNYFRNTK